ncbi:hypothetical protein MNV49_001208 [Pseudohyphozyma bogoriensis]|nr:hypothetical protein MNV49_001208 [Pseudohyphozyma bogoriensis]
MHFRLPLLLSAMGLASLALADVETPDDSILPTDLPASCTSSCNTFEAAAEKCEALTDEAAAIACVCTQTIYDSLESCASAAGGSSTDLGELMTEYLTSIGTGCNTTLTTSSVNVATSTGSVGASQTTSASSSAQTLTMFLNRHVLASLTALVGLLSTAVLAQSSGSLGSVPGTCQDACSAYYSSFENCYSSSTTDANQIFSCICKQNVYDGLKSCATCVLDAFGESGDYAAEIQQAVDFTHSSKMMKLSFRLGVVAALALVVVPSVLAQSQEDVPSQCQDTCKSFEDVQTTCSSASMSAEETLACVCNDDVYDSVKECAGCVLDAVGSNSQAGQAIAQGVDTLASACGVTIDIPEGSSTSNDDQSSSSSSGFTSTDDTFTTSPAARTSTPTQGGTSTISSTSNSTAQEGGAVRAINGFSGAGIMAGVMVMALWVIV